MNLNNLKCNEVAYLPMSFIPIFCKIQLDLTIVATCRHLAFCFVIFQSLFEVELMKKKKQIDFGWFCMSFDSYTIVISIKWSYHKLSFINPYLEKIPVFEVDVLGVLVVRWRVGHLVRIGFAEGVTNSRLERKKKKKG